MEDQEFWILMLSLYAFTHPDASPERAAEYADEMLNQHQERFKEGE